MLVRGTMSDRPIQVGDLVMIVRGHPCAVQIRGGMPYRVQEIVPQAGGGWTCNKCGERDIAKSDLYGAALWHTIPGNGIPLSFLKRIPPLDELEGQRTEETLKVSA